MATCTTAYWDANSSTPRVSLTVEVSSQTGSTVTLSWTFEYITSYAVSTSIPHDCTVTIDGSKVYDSSYAINGKKGTYTIQTGSKTVNKSTADRSVSFSCSMDFSGITWSGKYAGSNKTASGSISIDGKTSYTVTYNANGGTGAPSSQTKWHDTTLTLSSITPTRSGYTFKGWATSSSSTTVAYASGASYSYNESVTLYAVWGAKTYTVSYNANGGTGAPSSQTKTHNVSLTLSSTKPTRTDYNFVGWGTAASSTTVSYNPGSTYKDNASITLYAIWEVGYVKPRVYSLVVSRCNSDGTYNEEGTYANVTFEYTCDLTVSKVEIAWESYSSTKETTTVSASGTSGVITTTVGNGEISTDSTYTITVTVSDSKGSSSATTTLNGSLFPMDFKSGGTGVSFGKPSELGMTESLGGTGVADFAFDAKFNEPVYGKALGMDKLPQIPANSDLNDYKEPGCYAVYSNADAATCTNIPVDAAGRLEVWSATGEGLRTEEWSYIRQRYIPYNAANATWERDINRNTSNVWTYKDWWRSSLTPDASAVVYSGGPQKTLWSGAWYMTSGHTVNLSEPVSAQQNGIVLIFSAYGNVDGDAAAFDNDLHSFFISKLEVSLYEELDHIFVLARSESGIDYWGFKRLDISDTTISGYSINGNSGTNESGIKYHNGKFVLRRVLGV